MDLARWTIAIGLAVVFAGGGLVKQFVPKDKLVTSGQGWAQDYRPTNIRLIGLAEILGAVGLVLAARSADRPDICTAGCSRARTGDGGRGRGANRPASPHLWRGAVFVYAEPKFSTDRSDIEVH